jgi:sugar phosphate isomerase/epimerase
MKDKFHFSICEFTTPRTTFAEDLVIYRQAGATGIGVCEMKIADDREAAAKLRRSGMMATHCVPFIPSILPLPLMEGPEDPEQRVEALCASICRLAELDPVCCIFLTGPVGEWGETEARQIVVDALSVLALTAERAGVRIGLEPVHASQHDAFSFVHTIPDALTLLDEAGAASVGIMLDTWHLWETPNFADQVRAHAGRLAGVHVADWRQPTRSHFDRVLPGDGIIEFAPILRALKESGYDGWYDIEIFSDNGLPDSLWEVEPAELALRAYASFRGVWEAT